MANPNSNFNPGRIPVPSFVSRLPSFRQPLARDITRIPSLTAGSHLARSQSLRCPSSYQRPTPFRPQLAGPSNSNTRGIKASDVGKLEPQVAEEDEDAVSIFQKSPSPPAGAANRPTVKRAVTFRSYVPCKPVESAQVRPELQLHRTLSSLNAPPRITKESMEEFFQIYEERTQTKIQTFPSISIKKAKGASFTPVWSWVKEYKRLVEETEAQGSEESMTQVMSFYEQVLKAKGLLEQIRLDFQFGIMNDDPNSAPTASALVQEFGLSRPGERGRLIISDGSIPYIADIFANQLKAQDKYAQRLSKPLASVVEGKKRDDLVTTTMAAAITLKYAAETTHLAVYLVDSFLAVKGNLMTHNGWPLLGIAALHLAGKLEEAEHARAVVIRLIRLFGHSFKPEDVYWMEGRVLQQLKFDIYPPLAPLLAKLVIMGGSLNFPTPNIAKLVMDLSQGVLFKALTNYKLSSVRPSEGAQAAVEIAVEHIFNQYKLYSRRDLSRFQLVTSEPGTQIGNFPVELCYTLFRQRFTPTKQPSTAQSMVGSPVVSSPQRNVKV